MRCEKRTLNTRYEKYAFYIFLNSRIYTYVTCIELVFLEYTFNARSGKRLFLNLMYVKRTYMYMVCVKLGLVTKHLTYVLKTYMYVKHTLYVLCTMRDSHEKKEEI